MKNCIIHILTSFIILSASSSCMLHGFVCGVPEIDSFPNDFPIRQDEKVLVLPLWNKAPFNIGGEEGRGYLYFDNPAIIKSSELRHIKKIVPDKASSGIIAPGSAHGNWEAFDSLFLIFINGIVIHLQIDPDDCWQNRKVTWIDKKYGTIGPKWKSILNRLVVTSGTSTCNLLEKDQVSLCDQEISDFLDIYTEYPIKNMLSKSQQTDLLEFLNNTRTVTDKQVSDKWKNFPQ